MSTNYVAIPKLWESEKTLLIYFHDLPQRDEIVRILGSEEAPTHLWLELAMEYKRQGKMAEFVALLEASVKLSKSDYQGGQEHLRQCEVALAEYFYQLANQEEQPEQKDVWYHRANVLMTGANHGFKRKNHEDYLQNWTSSPGKRICSPQ